MSIIVQQVAAMYSLLYFSKLLYMFRVVTQPTIRSTHNCNCSIWHWSYFETQYVKWAKDERYGPVSTKFRDRSGVPTPLRLRKVSRHGSITLLFSWLHTHCIFRCLTSVRYCNYSYMCSWWWVELPPKTCRAVYRNMINCTWSHFIGQLLTLTHDARADEH
jgi:hypothetical protein